VINVEEKSSRRGSLLSVKRPVRRTVSDDSRLQQQQLQQLPMLTTQHLSRARNDLSPVSRPIYVHTRPFNGPLSGTTWVSRYQRGKTNLDFTGARDSESQRHQLGHMQVCTSLQADNHASTTPLRVLQVGCPSCRPTNSVKALE